MPRYNPIFVEIAVTFDQPTIHLNIAYFAILY